MNSCPEIEHLFVRTNIFINISKDNIGKQLKRLYIYVIINRNTFKECFMEVKKNKITQAILDNKFSYLAFAASAFVMLIVYYCFNVIPFGD